MTEENNSVVFIINDQIDWIQKHPQRFVNNLLSRLNSGETDRHPGYARWTGDGMPGVQVVSVGNSGGISIIAAGKNNGIKLGVVYCKNDGTQESKLTMLKQLANKAGYYLRKKFVAKEEEKKNNSNGNGDKRRNNNNKRHYYR